MLNQTLPAPIALPEPRSETAESVLRRPANVCIVQATAGGFSETFLRAHAERLPANVTVVYGSVAHVDGRQVMSLSRWARAVRKLKRIATGAAYVPETVSSFAQVFRSARADVVMAEYGPTGVRMRAPCRLVGIPLVVHFHGYDASMYEVLEEHGQDYPPLFQEAAAIVAVSRKMKQSLIDMGAPPEKVVWNPCGVDVEEFGGGDPQAAPPVFLTAGRFTEKKGPQLTLLAFAKAHERCPTARLRMAGDGHLLAACRDLAKALGIADAVTFLGAQPHGVVQDEMRRARAVLQHSIVAADTGDCEGTPVAVLEAGASGLPIIATRHAGIPDVVVDGATGLLVDEHDTDAMADAIVRLAEQPEFAARLGQAAREYVAAYFSMDHSIQRLWRVLEDCMVSPSPREEREKRSGERP